MGSSTGHFFQTTALTFAPFLHTSDFKLQAAASHLGSCLPSAVWQDSGTSIHRYVEAALALLVKSPDHTLQARPLA